MKEQKKKRRIVKMMIRESQETTLELSDSVDPSSPAGRLLKGLTPFLQQMQQEVTEELSVEVRKTLASKVADFFLTILLKPIKKLLLELWAKAVMVASQILGGR